MPDISMCPGTGCPDKRQCYRYCAVPTPRRQSYFAVAPYDEKAKKCEYRWPLPDGAPLDDPERRK